MTILFIDIVGSTQLGERLDPESLRQVMDRYFSACATAVAEHGGSVEKFIGDAVMAAFGATVGHEDDALRAVRAAVAALDALRALSAELARSHQITLEARCGICSGDVLVTVLPGGDFRVVGDAANTASRLQAAARPGEILIGADAAAMVRSQVGIEAVPPLRLKGKARAVAAWRVTRPELAAEPAAPPPAPLIGRSEELAVLGHSYRRAAHGPQVCLVTVLGAAGIGKSRLVREFLGTLEDARPTILSGRCSAYGAGVTYKPLADMLGSGPGGWASLEKALSADPDLGTRAASSLSTIMGAAGSRAAGADGPGGQVPAGVEEIAWAVRHLLEMLSGPRPVVMVWEDLHWAEPTLLDLIDEVADWLRDVPVLLVCLARSELLDVRPSWGGGKPCATTLEVGPLSAAESAELVAELAARGEVSAHDDSGSQGRIAAQCEGNPLFAELMLDVFAGVAPGERIPPSIHALLGARLDQLPEDERRLLEMAAVIGREFGRDDLRAMAELESFDGALADALTRRLIRRRLVAQAGPGAYRFAQTLLRDAAYSFTPKARRERWHRLLAARHAARRGPGDAPDQDSSLAFAYHAEAACRLRRDLRPGEPGLPDLALQAAGVLIAAGMSALARKDLPAAAALLERGRDLLPAGDPRHTSLALHICDSVMALRDEPRSLAALSAAETALAGDRRNASACAIQRRIVGVRLGAAPPGPALADSLLLAAGLQDDPEDHLSWCRLHQLEAYLHLAGERAARADDALRLGLARARSMGDRYEEDRLLCAICELAQWAPTPVGAGLDLCAGLAQRFAANRALLVPVLVTRARLAALAGDLAGARADLATALSHVNDLHMDLADAAVLEMAGFVESLAGAHADAEERYRQALAALRDPPQSPYAQAISAAIARELFSQGRVGAAAAALDRLAADGGDLAPRARIAASALRGRIASARGSHAEAVRRAREAADLSAGTDDPCLAGDALLDLAVALRAAGLAVQAGAAGAQALARFEAKGAALPAASARAWLAGSAGAEEGGTVG